MSVQERETPAANYGSVEQPHLEQPARKCCKIRYRARYFYSKGAFLVLLWGTLVSVALYTFCRSLQLSSLQKILPPQYANYGLLILLPFFACVPLAGWLADAKLGNFKVFKAGSVLSFLAAITACFALLLTEYRLVPEGFVAVQVGSSIIGIVGTTTCLFIALQLGLDQMPGASAANITSFITWFVAACYGCSWLVYTLLEFVLRACIKQEAKSDKLIIDDLSLLLPAFCMTIVCCTIFIFAPRYLVIEPNSPQSLKTIYRVLKFAAKHKVPLNRSAFTYWEEDIPSRIDLGKSKYGGPFTTEQVENVKTFLKMLVLFVSFPFIGLASTMNVFEIRLAADGECSTNLFLHIFISNIWWGTIGLNEFAIYPLVRDKLPTTLARIGVISFFLILVQCSYLAKNVDVLIMLSCLNIFFTVSLFTGVLEFVCAQSPYNMRGLLTGCSVLLIFLSITLRYVIINILKTLSASQLIFELIPIVLSLVGFIFYCLLARWYKRRVRDEDYPTQRVVEEVYDRYLSHVSH